MSEQTAYRQRGSPIASSRSSLPQWAITRAAALAVTVAAALAAPAVVTTQPPRRAGLSRRAMVLSLGGAALAAAGAGMSSRVLARERVATGVGERRTIRLAADARADLNTDSRLSWRVREAATEAWLERGESAIAVSPGAPLRHQRKAASSLMSVDLSSLPRCKSKTPPSLVVTRL